MNVLSLFSGIGGLDLGLQRAGMTIAGQVEIDPWCRTILAKHWPEVPRHDDVRTCIEWWTSLADTDGAGLTEQRRPEPVPAAQPAAERCGWCCVKNNPPRWATHLPRFDACYCTGRRPAVDLVAGGFPCQPVSLAGKGLGQADSRWLWPAFADVIRDLRPSYVLVENVPGLLARGMGDVLGDLATLGYDAEWDCVPAAFVGAPHIRNRVFVVAYPAWLRDRRSRQRTVDDGPGSRGTERLGTVGGEVVADAEGQRGELRPAERRRPGRPASRRPDVADAGSRRHRPPQPLIFTGRHNPLNDRRWPAEPGVGRVAHGIPRRVDRLRGLGNAVVPQVAEHIGRLIIQAEHAA